MTSENDTSEENAARAALIHREILQLGILTLVAVLLFFITRAVAASNREMSLRDAAEWYRRGQQGFSAGRVEEAIENFRRATVRNRTDKQYVLALARALARNQDDEAARSVLLTLRDTAPEDAEINLELARLAARRQNVTEAARYYDNALYAPWPIDSADARRRVRLELIRFLLTHDQSARALSELLAAAADLPEQASVHLEVAELFGQAGDDTHALDQFQRALRLDPENGIALAGAGLRAFQLGRYGLARTYLGRTPIDVEKVRTTREIVERVLIDDPLAARIRSGERRRRLMSDLDYARERLAACSPGPAGSPAGADVTLEREADAFASHFKQQFLLDQDTIEAGVDLVDRIADRVVQACGSPAARDRALTLIGREHSGNSR